MNEIIKKVLLIIALGLIVYFVVVFIISVGAFVLFIAIFATSLIGIFTIWEKYAKKELIKKDESLDILTEEK